MEHFYKEHQIQIIVWEDSTGGWVANLYIYYQEGVQSRLVTFILDQIWATYSEALEAGPPNGEALDRSRKTMTREPDGPGSTLQIGANMSDAT
jgi:hypothetical protein